MGRVTWTRYYRFDLGFPVNSIDRSTSLGGFLSLSLSLTSSLLLTRES